MFPRCQLRLGRGAEDDHVLRSTSAFLGPRQPIFKPFSPCPIMIPLYPIFTTTWCSEGECGRSGIDSCVLLHLLKYVKMPQPKKNKDHRSDNWQFFEDVCAHSGWWRPYVRLESMIVSLNLSCLFASVENVRHLRAGKSRINRKH